eukprot:GHVR01027566.1.p2 GENE.GHVR01027566.1~~GHVR01027566.1.p2  ORF type:complete len:105 (+),score=8.06 GHVR01027566.1:204-518(+)
MARLVGSTMPQDWCGGFCHRRDHAAMRSHRPEGAQIARAAADRATERGTRGPLIRAGYPEEAPEEIGSDLMINRNPGCRSKRWTRKPERVIQVRELDWSNHHMA